MRSRDEFRHAIKDMRRDGVPNSVCDHLFREFDADGSGEISYEEYMRYVLRDSLRRQVGKVMDFVKPWDVDGSGEIERWEFRRAMASMGIVAPSIAMIDALFDEMDVDNSGSLSTEEIFHHIRGGRGARRAGGVSRSPPRRRGLGEERSPSPRPRPLERASHAEAGSSSGHRRRIIDECAASSREDVARSLPMLRPPAAAQSQSPRPSAMPRPPRQRDVAHSLPMLSARGSPSPRGFSF